MLIIMILFALLTKSRNMNNQSTSVCTELKKLVVYTNQLDINLLP